MLFTLGKATWQKTGLLIKAAYHFDIHQHSHKVPAQVQGLLIAISLIVPPLIVIVGFLSAAPSVDQFSFTITSFSDSTPVPVEGDRVLVVLLAAIIFMKFALLAALAPVDLLVRSQLERKRVAWEDCFAFSLASAFILLSGFFIVQTPLVEWLVSLVSYLFNALDNLEPVITLPFIVLVVLVYFIDDVFFYIGHRLAHNVRVIWKLGHMQHHRPSNLTTATSCADFSLFFLDGGGGSFVTSIVGKAVFLKMLSDVDATGALGAAFVIATLNIINHTMSHSYSAYLLFSKYPFLAWFEKFFVTGRIHYVHHSKLPEHNVSSGCNFAAQFVWLDKLLGTYAAPSKHIPPTGLFHEKKPPGNPIKFAFDQWIRFARELASNHPRYWFKIFFADPGYEPPNPVYT